MLIIAVLIASLMTVELCRYNIARDREPSLWHAAAISIVTAVLTLALTYGSDLLTMRFWTEGKAPMTILVPGFFAVYTLLLLAPTAAVVWLYRATSE